MTLLADHEIRARCQGERPMIAPFEYSLQRTIACPDVLGWYKAISYGPSSAGYDIRASDVWWEFKRDSWWRRAWRALSGSRVGAIDPKAFDVEGCMVRAPLVETGQGLAYLMPPHSYALTHSVEYFRVPDDVIGVCVGKSTYARCGLVVNVTPLEAGWEGVLVVEVANTTPRPLLVYCGEGIAQVLFHHLPNPPSTTYAARQGKYQGQTGLTFAKV